MTQEEVTAAKVVSQLMGGVTEEVEETSEPGESLNKILQGKTHAHSECEISFLCTPALFFVLSRRVLGCSGRKRRVPELCSPAERGQDTTAVCRLQQHREAHCKIILIKELKMHAFLKFCRTAKSSGFETL